MIENIDKGDEEQLNFADYLFIRRVKVGWDRCAAGGVLSIAYVSCALRIAVPGYVADVSVAH